MDGLLSLLLFGGVFLLMMRFGCGAHVMHGGHDKQPHQRNGEGETDHIDPVCGMTVDPNEGYGKVYQGNLYRFCSRDCLDRFDADPEAYMPPKQLEGKS
jgi:YHS domain-containing protein